MIRKKSTKKSITIQIKEDPLKVLKKLNKSKNKMAKEGKEDKRGKIKAGTKEAGKMRIFKIKEGRLKKINTDAEIDALPPKEREEVLKMQEQRMYAILRKEKEVNTPKGSNFKFMNAKRKGLHSSVVQKGNMISKRDKAKNKEKKYSKKKVQKDSNEKTKMRNNKKRLIAKELKKKLNEHLLKGGELKEGGSLKDDKAQEILQGLESVEKNTIYMDKLIQIKDTQIETGKGDVPSLLDFGITYKEARFITEFIKSYDEVDAALKSKITLKSMNNTETERCINEVLNNPNVAEALQCAMQDQIHRTLLTSDRVLTQIGKIAFSDPIEMFKDDESGSLKDLKDIPPALRSCISEMTHKTLFEGRGRDRTRVGFITKIKLHDSLKALQVILKDLRDKSEKLSNNIQFNQYNLGIGNVKESIKQLSNEELDILIKISNQGVESGLKSIQHKKKGELKDSEELNIEDSTDEIIELARAKNLKDGTQLYGLSELKDIEQCNLDT